MFKLNLKIALRNLFKRKGYTLINIAGLSIGMASCILIYMFISFELSYDQSFSKKNRIYRVITSFDYSGTIDYSQGVSIPLTQAIKEEFPQVERAAALQLSGGILKIKDKLGKEKIKTAEDIFYAGPEFFEVFNTQWLLGNPISSLSQPNTIVLSKKMARRYFGNYKEAMGRIINFQNKIDFKVTGVIDDLPENTSFPLNIILSYASYPNRSNKNWESIRSASNCYLLLKKGTNIREFENALSRFTADKYRGKNMVGKVNHLLQPLHELHYDERVGNPANKTVSMKSIIGMGIIGLFLLLTACINFINMATAQMISRSKEVGVRKVMGSSRNQLTWQFLWETGLITSIAVVFAGVFVELAGPALSTLLQSDIKFAFLAYPSVWFFIGALWISVSFFAGFYPAIIMSGFSPVLAIKNKGIRSDAGGLNLRKILMLVQFSITAMLVIGTLVVIRQMKYIREKPLGFSTKTTAIVDIPTDSLSKTKFGLLREKLALIPGVKGLSFCNAAPTSNNNYDTDFSYDHKPKADFSVSAKSADEDYFNTFGMKIIAGRAFYKSDTIKEFVVNETLLKKLKVKNPEEALGKFFTMESSKGIIVGVVQDFVDQSLHEMISPVAISTSKTEYYAIAVKLDTKSVLPVMKQIEQQWNSIFPDHVYGAVFLDDQVNQYYKTEQVMGALFKVFAAMIIFISFIGLFGLVSFVSTQRTKEIAIRKVLGASTFELVAMLNSSFLKMVLFANLLAWPVAYIYIHKWLAGFAYRIDMNFWPFALAMTASLGLTFIIVSLRSYGAANTNPVKALKEE
jgi:ABC-type antimicrobial peptide transport system permease subunit